jgi:hypothetical protein
MEPGDHECLISESYISGDGYEGAETLILWLRDKTGAKGKVRYGLAPDKITYLKALMRILAPEVNTIKAVREAVPGFVGLIVAVKSIQKERYVNHYINAVVGRAEKPTAPTQPAGDAPNADEIPF